VDTFASLQDVANLVVFVAPGYFALRTYSLIYSKDEKEFTRLLIESVACSLPIVSFFNFVWPGTPATVLDIEYILPLLGFSIVAGYGFARLRGWGWKPFKRLMRVLGLHEPNEDFMGSQFQKLGKNDFVTVTLRTGAVFSGMPKQSNTYRRDGARQYYFSSIAWYDQDKGTWDNRPGGLIVDLSEVEYLETSRPLPGD
jgi:hypothetical protein